MNCSVWLNLTADVGHWAANAVSIDRLAAVNLEGALLHDAGRVVLDAVAEVAGVGWVGGDLHPVHVELALDVAAARVGGGG